MGFYEPELRAGFEPGTDALDNVQRAFVLSMADFLAAIARGPEGRFEADDTVAMCDTACPSALGNWTLLVQPVADPAPLAAEVHRFYDDNAGGSFIVASPWPVLPLGEGYRRVGHPPFMVRPAGGTVPPVPAGLRVERVTTAAQLAGFNRALALGFPVAECVDRPLYDPSVLDDPNIHFFVGSEDGVPVATAIGHVTDGIQHVESVSTLEERRGRGYGAAVTWAAATVDPSLPAGLIASDAGRPVYERMGFLALERWSLFEGTRR